MLCGRCLTVLKRAGRPDEFRPTAVWLSTSGACQVTYEIFRLVGGRIVQHRSLPGLFWILGSRA